MIKFDNVFFSFGNRPVFEGLTLALPDRCIIRAPSGRGKTTLLRLVAGLIKPDSGTVTGAPDRISFLFQDDRLLPWLTVRQNIAAVLPHGSAEADEYLEKTELSDYADALPENLSGGQRRRAAFARALAYKGKLLILDEPFKGLDEPLMRRMAEITVSSCANILMVSHSDAESALIGGETVTL